MSVLSYYEQYGRQLHVGSWSLSWCLAAELCRRYHTSHGIQLGVIVREGLGFYGIQIGYTRCRIHGDERDPLGRFTIAGNVENWEVEGTAGIGGHGLKLEGRAAAGEPVDKLLRDAIAYLRLPLRPEKAHTGCRHNRRGASFCLTFDVAATIAIKHPDRARIWTERSVRRYGVSEPEPDRQHPGYFILSVEGSPCILAGSGEVIQPAQQSLWDRYMAGDELATLVAEVEGWIGL